MPEGVSPQRGKVTIYRNKLMADVNGRIESKMRQTVEAVANEVRRLQRGPKHGLRYRIGKTPTKADRKAGRRFRSYQASAPGEAPAVRSGTLFNSIRTRVMAMASIKSSLTWMGQIGTNKYYAPYLEYGTPRMKPRPMWIVAVRNVRAQLKAIWDS